MSSPHPPDLNGGSATPAAAVAAAENLAPAPAPVPKRQRRPSVRLGEIGDQPAALIPSADPPPLRRPIKHFKTLPSTSSSKSRPLTNLKFRSTATEDTDLAPIDDHHHHHRKVRRARRARTNWAFKDTSTAATAELRSSPGEDAGEVGYVEDSDNSLSDWGRARTDEGDDEPSETDNRDWGGDENRRDVEEGGGGGGVRGWLERLGLGQYGAVFQIHEVDDEVLPMLTLDDLKEMGVNAVGSRRKMYCAIQKLRKNAAG